MVMSGCSLLFLYMKYYNPLLYSILVSYFSKLFHLILFMSDNACIILGVIFLNGYPTVHCGSWDFQQLEKWDWEHVCVLVLIPFRIWSIRSEWADASQFFFILYYIVFFFNSWTTFRCCCTRGTARSNYFYRCCNEERTHQTEFFSWFIPWHVITDPRFCVYLHFPICNPYCYTLAVVCVHCSSILRLICVNCTLLGLYAMHIQQEQIYCGQVCRWLLCLWRKWLLGLPGHSALPLDWGRRWLWAGQHFQVCFSVQGALARLSWLFNITFSSTFQRIRQCQYAYASWQLFLLTCFPTSVEPCVAWKSMKKERYPWLWIGRSFKLLLLSLKLYAWHALCLTQPAGWVEIMLTTHNLYGIFIFCTVL